MSQSNVGWWQRIALGAVGGFAGTALMMGLRAANGAVAPQTLPPMRREPGKFMVDRAESAMPAAATNQVPGWAEETAAAGLGVGYGLAFGSLYAVARPDGGPALRDGVALGVATWAAGYLGWLPALGIMKPVTKQTGWQVALPIVEHAAYGVAVVAVYNRLLRRARVKATSQGRPEFVKRAEKELASISA